MNYPKIFDYFDANLLSPGASVYDFLGSETPVSYKKGWKPILHPIKSLPPLDLPLTNGWQIGSQPAFCSFC